jgi:formylglycine-generating enzyme required for sulfatase activity
LCGVGLSFAQVPAAREHTNSLGMKFVRIEPGEFVMGQGDGPPTSRDEWLKRDWDESPAHKVKITHAFFMGVHEVTNAQYEQFDPEHKKLRGKFGGTSGNDEPVVHVTWQQAADFCKWLTQKEGKAYRLPTEAEWEYACRAGTTTTYHTGDTLTAAQANIGVDKDGKKRNAALPVGSIPPNAWGLHDMHGNVAEWCWDWYGPYEAAAQSDPAGRIDGHARVCRGWSYLITTSMKDSSRYCRSSNRSGHVPEDANRYTGFRVALGDRPDAKLLPTAAPPLHQQNVKQARAPKDGPDANKPFYISYNAAKKNPTIPPNTFGPIFSNHNHYGTVCVCPNGDVLAVWYTCVQEPGRELSQAASRLRAGSDTWEPASLFFSVPDVNCHAPVLLSDGKRLYHFGTLSLHGWDYASDMMRVSDDNGATWSKPQIILPRDRPDALSQPCSAFVAKDGTLVLACDGDVHRDERTMTSKDGGKTWQVGKGEMRAACGGKYVIHPAAHQRADGALVAYLRGQHPMPKVVSDDMGESWKMETTPFPGIGGGQKAHALKLASGALLFHSFDNKKELVGGGSFLALSNDDGKTWSHLRKSDVGGYTYLAQAPNGVIYLFGSRTGCAAFNEAWLREGKGLKGSAQQ